MRFLLAAVLVASALAASGARADAMPDCPPGTLLRENPVEPGAMHHGGGECVDDPAAGGCGGCAVTGRDLPTGLAVGGLLALGLVASRRR